MDDAVVAPKRPQPIVVFGAGATALYLVKTIMNHLIPSHHLAFNPWGVFMLLVGAVAGVSFGGFAHIKAHFKFASTALGARASQIEYDPNKPDESGNGVYFAMFSSVFFIAAGLDADHLAGGLETLIFMGVVLLTIATLIFMKIRNPDRLAAKLTMKDGQPVADLSGNLNLRLTPAQLREIDAYNAKITGQRHTMTAECRL